MKQSFIVAIALGLFIPCVAFSQNTAQTEDRDTNGDRGNRGGMGDNKNRDKRNNNDISGKGLRIIDTDKDGQISIEEYMAHAQERFSDLDLDGNNFVTPEEAKEAAKIMRQKQREARSALDRRKQNSQSQGSSD